MFLSGLIIGAAAVYFIKSESGKEMIEQARKKSLEAKSILENKSHQLIDSGKAMLDSVVQTGENLVSGAKDKALNVGDNIKENVEDTVSDFQRGIEKGKEELKKA